jgi:hypothetical protein
MKVMSLFVAKLASRELLSRKKRRSSLGFGKRTKEEEEAP